MQHGSLSITGLPQHSLGKEIQAEGRACAKSQKHKKKMSHSENYKLCSSADTQDVGRWSGGRVCVCVLEGRVLLLSRRWVGKKTSRRDQENLQSIA